MSASSRSQVCNGRVPGGQRAEGGGGREDEALLCQQEPQRSHKVDTNYTICIYVWYLYQVKIYLYLRKIYFDQGKCICIGEKYIFLRYKYICLREKYICLSDNIFVSGKKYICLR